MVIHILRGPETSNKWTDRGSDGQIIASDNFLALRGKITVTTGHSEIEFQVESESFAELARAMIAVNKEAALKAFGEALISAAS